VDVGFLVCSHDSTVLNTSTFDHVAAGQVASAPPSAPASPSPANGTTGVSVAPNLTWSATGAANYDVKLGVTNPPSKVSTAQTASAFQASSLVAGTTYYWQVIAYNSTGSTSGPVWSFATAATTPSSGVPSPWQTTDVGNVQASGTASFSSGAFTVVGGGADIWGSSDAFRYVYQPLNGDGQLVARVTSLTNTNPYAKAGLMIRSSLDPASPHVILDVLPDGSIEFMKRASQGGATDYIAGAAQTPPAWLKLVRSASTVTGYVSRDGSAWTQVGSTSVSLPAATVAGLVVSSHDVSLMATGIFDSVALTTGGGSQPPPTSGEDVVIYASDATSASLHGAWRTTSSAASPGSIALTTTDRGVSNTNAALAAPVDYVDLTFTAAANTPYRIWLRLRATNDNKFNDSLWAQFSDALIGGSAAYRVNTTSGLLVNLATDSSGGSLSGWGWQNAAYWLSQGTTVTFATDGMHTIRLQTREDGLNIDQIVLSPSTYLNAPPGPVGGDGTIVSR
jgi:hypothetical protein